jgi:hypothetical protein
LKLKIKNNNMKKVYFLTVLFLIGTLSCTKNPASIGNNSWTLGGKTYTAGEVAYSVVPLSLSGTGTVKAGDLNAVIFSTNGPPTATLNFMFQPEPAGIGGKYLIDGTSNADPEAFISVQSKDGNIYYSGKPNIYLQVTIISNDKVSASFPGKIWVYNAFNAQDSLQLSVGTITEQ